MPILILKHGFDDFNQRFSFIKALLVVICFFNSCIVSHHVIIYKLISKKMKHMIKVCMQTKIVITSFAY